MQYLKQGLMLFLILFIASCSKLPVNNNSHTQALAMHKSTPFYKKIKPLLQKHKGKSGYYLLTNNLDAFAARITLLKHAKYSIDTQYYVVADDLTGKLFLKSLLDAADRGVKVRLLMDDLNIKGRDAEFIALATHPNMQIRVFNPSTNRTFPKLDFITNFKRLNRRMHNKSLTVDGIATIVGGRNIGDNYFSASKDLEFRDLDLLALGPDSKKVSKIFDMFWNDTYAYPFKALHKKNFKTPTLNEVRKRLAHFEKQESKGIYLQHAKSSKFTQDLLQGKLPLKWAFAKVWSDNPKQARTKAGDMQYSMAPKIFAKANQAKKSITIIAPYFIPRKWKDAFLNWQSKGILVRVLTNSLASNDVPAVHSGYSHYRKYLLRAGVKLYELKPNIKREKGGVKTKKSGLHAKSLIFDTKKIFVGSMNLDPRSTVLNTEMGILANSATLSKELETMFNKKINKIAYELKLVKKKNGFEHIEWIDTTPQGTIRYTQEPHAGVLRRIGVDLLKVLPIKSEL